MLVKIDSQTAISIPGALKLIGIISGTWGILVSFRLMLGDLNDFG